MRHTASAREVRSHPQDIHSEVLVWLTARTPDQRPGAVTYIQILNRQHCQLRERPSNPRVVSAALRALADAAQLAGRDVGAGTFDWVQYAVAVSEACSAIHDTGLPVADDSEAPLPEIGEDSPQLRWVVMQLAGSTTQALAEAAAAEPDRRRREAYVLVTAKLTEAAAHLRNLSLY